MRQYLLSVVILLCCTLPAVAQLIHGDAIDMASKQPIDSVVIDNIHTNVSIVTAKDGSFVIAGQSGQLLEFRKPGYKVTRVRIPMGYVPPYFRIIMQRGLPDRQELQIDKPKNYRDDSMDRRNMYGYVLDIPKMSTFEKIRSPFSALSARNRQIWQFQDVFEENEQEKYVEYKFNRDLVQKVTGLKGDSLTVYMNRFRPTYQQLRSMNEYTYFTYIKNTVTRFRSRNTPRSAQ